MQINSLLFLFLFLPLALVLTLVSGRKIRNATLFMLSLIFYAWGGVGISVILILSIIFNYVFGIFIQKNAETKKAKILLYIAVTVNILLLVFFKYLTFIFANVNELLAVFGSAPMLIKKAAIPLGISFFTLCNISYLIDIKRGHSKAERNFINFALFISFFPRIVSGPIVRYGETQDQLRGRKITLELFSKGIERFIIGLSKKVIIADTFALIADQVFSLPAGDLTFYYAWIGIISYSLQLYVDFSAYSDMAIGIGKMFGFTIPENFNLPYLAKSVQEFWQRWHISLSSWLRDYLFTPLSVRYRNMGKMGVALSVLITFLLCGLWHNAGWTFIVWGLIHGFFLTLESLGFGNFLKKIWRPLRHIYLILVVLFGWVFFRSNNLSYAWEYCMAMMDFSGISSIGKEFNIVNNNSFILSFIFAMAGSFGIFAFCGKYFKKLLFRFSPGFKGIALISSTLVEMIVLFLAFIIAVSYISVNNYSPFIYFRF